MFRLSSRLCLATVLTFVLSSAASAGLIFDVNVMVQGYPGTQKIGSIDANSGPATNTDHLTALFKFADPFKGSILDGWYDFQWVNVVTSGPTDWSSYAKSLFDSYPNIDPQAPPKNSAEDNEPYYYNQTTEWDVGMFGSEDIRDEGVFSLFSDSPDLLAGDSFKFDTFLVAQDLTAGDFTGKKFSVLAGFNWTYTGGTDVSTVGSEITINAATITGINTALGNEANNTFDDWTALAPQTLRPCVVPEPDSLTLFGLGALCLVGWGWRRRRETEQLALAA
jgi:hypothetical protein